MHLLTLKKAMYCSSITTADDKDGFAEVFNNTVTGKISDTFLEAIRVDGKTYDFIHDAAEDAKYDKKDYAKCSILEEKTN